MPYLRGSIIVKFRPGTGPAVQQAMLARAGASKMDVPSYADFNIVTIDDNADPEVTAAAFAAAAGCRVRAGSLPHHPMFVPNDPLYSQQWNYPAIDMEHAWDSEPRRDIVNCRCRARQRHRVQECRASAACSRVGVAAGVRPSAIPALGIVDIPFAAAPDLGGRGTGFVAPRDFIWNDTDPLDLDGHGTHVAGTIGQLTNNNIGVAGMAFNVRIMPVKVIPVALGRHPRQSRSKGPTTSSRAGALRGRQRRQGDQHEHRPRRGVPHHCCRMRFVYASTHGAFVADGGRQ